MKVHKLITVRSTILGRKPTVSDKTLTNPASTKQNIKQIWYPQETEFNSKDKRYLMAAALEIGVKAAFDLHIYSFGGKM